MAFLPEIKAEHVAMTCGTIVAVFQGENQQCNDFDACVDFVNAIPLGNWDLADQDNVICCQLHMLLAAFCVKVHCVHCDVDGGSKCHNNSHTESTRTNFLFGKQCNEWKGHKQHQWPLQ